MWEQLIADHPPLDAARQLARILGVLLAQGAAAVVLGLGAQLVRPKVIA